MRRAYTHAAEFWGERREMMQVWADYLDDLQTAKERFAPCTNGFSKLFDCQPCPWLSWIEYRISISEGREFKSLRARHSKPCGTGTFWIFGGLVLTLKNRRNPDLGPFLVHAPRGWPRRYGPDCQSQDQFGDGRLRPARL